MRRLRTFLHRIGELRWTFGSIVLMLMLTLVSAVFGTIGEPLADTSLSRDDKIKAAIVYKLTRYVEWPADSLGGAGTPFSLCMLGDGAFAAALFSTEQFAVDGHPIRFRTVKDPERASGCHLLFIPAAKSTPSVMRAIQRRSRPMLTVGDTTYFAESGGMIGLVTEDQRTRFEINLRQVREAGLKIRVELLDLATIIGGR